MGEVRAQLDPSLFDADHRVHPEVRRRLLDMLHTFLAASFSSPETWATASIGGWGSSFQLAGGQLDDGKPGGLDVLVFVDWDRFYLHQDQDIGQMPIRALTKVLNYLLRSNLWPRTADTPLGSRTYEVTYSVTPAALGSSMVASYDLSADRWVGGRR